MRPASCSGISEWMMPRPAVIHCTLPGLEQADVADAVAMAHAALEHDRHGLEAAVRMVGKAADVVGRGIAAEGVEHQERVEPALQRLRQDAGQADAVAVGGRLAADGALDAARAEGSGGSGGVHATQCSADSPRRQQRRFARSVACASNSAGRRRSGVIAIPRSPTTDPAMKLYYSPGACSLSPHIVLKETGLPFEAVLASTKTKKLVDGTDYYTHQQQGLRADCSSSTTAAASPKARRSSSTSPTRCRRRSWRRRPGRCRATACRNGSTSSPASCTRASAACSTRRCPKRRRR